MKRLLFCFIFLICYFFPFINTEAEICDDNHVASLKKLANDVEVSYEYIQDDNVVNIYNLTFTGMINDFIVIGDKKQYSYDSFNEGILSIQKRYGTYQFNFYSDACPNILLVTKEVKLPKFNTYSLTSECAKLKDYDLDVCDEWYQPEITDEVFYSMIDKYIDDDNEKIGLWGEIISFIQKYYLYLVGAVALIIVIIIGIIIYRKRSVLE